MAGSWRWSAAALLLTGGLGASVAAVQTEVAPRERPARPMAASMRRGEAHGVIPRDLVSRSGGDRSGGAPAEPDRGSGGRLVVLDPGHGGSNTGAASVVPGVYEKHLTMLLTRAVAGRLEARGIQVRLTRELDEYVSLRERVERANRLRADLFVSIHANASEARSQRGFETWVLAARAVDIDGRAIRGEASTPRAAADPTTARMLDDVERGLSQSGAADLAAAIQGELAVRRGRDRDRGVRQSSMDVLLGANMPAALVEVGFIDHPIEGHELLEPEVQSALADAIAAGIAAQLAR